MENTKKTSEEIPQRTRTKTLRLFSTVFFCLIIIFSACKCPQLGYSGKYALDVITQRDLYRRVIDNPNWAQKLDLPGLPNLHKVSDNLYRGAQPNEEGLHELKKLGIKTIVNLRSEHSDRDKMENIDISYKNIPMTASKPKIEDIITFLIIVADSNNAPVFVHCRHGADRTGMMSAIYRIFLQNWSKEDAIEEMTKGGFGFHSIWGNLADFIRKLDVEKIKQQTKENKE